MTRILLIAYIALVPTLCKAQTPHDIATYLAARAKMCEAAPDSVFPTIRHLEQMRSAAKDSVTWAMLSECLNMMYGAYEWTAQHDSRGESLEEWGRGQWRKAARQCADDARTPIDALHRAKARDWQPVVALVAAKDPKGQVISGSKWFGNDLLHILHRNDAREHVARYYADHVGGDAAVMACLFVDGCNLDSLLHVAESDPKVCDAVRVEVMRSLIGREQDEDRRVKLCLDCVNRYGNEPATNDVRNTLADMRRPYLNVQWPRLVYPGREYRVPVSYRNISGIETTVGRATQTLPVRQIAAHTSVYDTLTLVAPSAGRYHVSVRPRITAKVQSVGNTDTCTMYVSPLRLLRLAMPRRDSVRFIVVDAMSGERVNRRVQVFDKPNRAGRGSERMVRIADDPQPAVRYWCSNDFNPNHIPYTSINIYTDRAIYRPGQTVQLSGMAYRQHHWDATVVADTALCLEVRDNNGNRIHADTLRTDDFGCVSTQFVLPRTASLGHYNVMLGGSWHSIRVDEYKRPTFETVFADSLHADTVRLHVRHFNGTPARGARVTGNYTVRGYWWRIAEFGETGIDTLYTDADGSLSIPVLLPADDQQRRGRCIELRLDVMAANGETRQAVHVYPLGNDVQPLREPQTMPRDTVAWFRCLSDTIHADRPARIEVGSAASDVHLFMAVFRDRDVVEESEIVFGDSLLTLEFPYSLLAGHPECDGIGVSLAFVKDDCIYSTSYSLCRPVPDRRLRWRWETFRDHVVPGAGESWSGTLLMPGGSPADAHAMFTVYDASLDEFAAHGWHMGLGLGHSIFSSRHEVLSRISPHYGYISAKTSRFAVPQLLYCHFDTSLLPSRKMYYDRAVPMAMSSRKMMLRTSAKEVAVEECADDCAVLNASVTACGAANDAGADTAPATAAPAVARSNFAETACFVPALRTDKDGRVTFNFTLPDCMTTWRVLGVAHTRDMFTANIQAETVAQKALMALVDAPRFLRRGDAGSVAVTVQNIAGERQSVELCVQTLDAATERVLYEARQSFALNGDTVFTLPLVADDACIVKAVAVSDKGSDGEQREVPVLDDSEWVANATDLMCIGAGTHVFCVDSLFADNAVERRVTVQYTQSPVWTAIDVLRNISVPQHDDAISLHTALYAVTLTDYLCQQHPGVAAFLQHDADSARLAIESLAGRLAALQHADGGYSWLPGCDWSSEWVTTEIATTMARLKAMTGRKQPQLANAVRYLRRCNAELLRKHNGYLGWQYMYVLALSGEKMSGTDRQALDSLMTEKYLAREQMVVATVALRHLGRKVQAADMLARMQRYLVPTQQGGLAFSYLRGSFACIDRKLLDHVFAMEAVQDSSLVPMRRHLLQQKRVQTWDNQLVNVSAVYALLLGTQAHPEAVPNDRLHIDDITMDITDGQHKQTIPLAKPVSRVTVEKHGEGESWGAVYVESKQRLSDIHQNNTGLAVRRYADNAVAVGDKAEVRLVITADRDYECVHITVARPACLEPVGQLSRYQRQGGLGYYHEVHDDRDDILIEHLPKGSYVLVLPAYVVRHGRYNTGITKIECMYAPEFCGHTANIQLTL